MSDIMNNRCNCPTCRQARPYDPPQVCGTCRYYDPHGETCRRYAPNRLTGITDCKTDWGIVSPTDWCGEWEEG